MSAPTPTPELDARYGEAGVAATPWATVEQALTGAELYWLTTVRRSGGPHMTPLIGVYADGALHFCTGPEEEKARNIAGNAAVLMSTGATRCMPASTSPSRARRRRSPTTPGCACSRRRGRTSTAPNGTSTSPTAPSPTAQAAAEVFLVEPTRAYAFGKDPYSHTRYRFA